MNEKDKSRSETRRNRIKKIKHRLQLIKSVFNRSPKFDGMFQNNNEVNHLAGGGRRIKTNTRKGSATYRHHGMYANATVYNRHDQRQVDDFNDQLYEYATDTEVGQC